MTNALQCARIAWRSSVRLPVRLSVCPSAPLYLCVDDQNNNADPRSKSNRYTISPVAYRMAYLSHMCMWLCMCAQVQCGRRRIRSSAELYGDGFVLQAHECAAVGSWPQRPHGCNVIYLLLLLLLLLFIYLTCYLTFCCCCWGRMPSQTCVHCSRFQPSTWGLSSGIFACLPCRCAAVRVGACCARSFICPCLGHTFANLSVIVFVFFSFFNAGYSFVAVSCAASRLECVAALSAFSLRSSRALPELTSQAHFTF